ncbi:unnamed protein product [Ilex paraguariensis]|uniref:Uncharacterized protein n=1 Tax=Ilex paraguariensis TaxID=185542 RepID=A0ABC8RCV9_9AQUA
MSETVRYISRYDDFEALQQQQWYDKETALAEIDYSRKKLLEKLKEYKGEDLEVIHEATAFAGETVEDNNDLLLPPYPSRPSRSLVSNNGYVAHFPPARKSAQNRVISGDPKNELKKARKLAQNRVISGDPKNELKKGIHDSGRNEVQPETRGSLKGVRVFISMVAKSMLTFVGVVSVLSLAGFEPRFRRRDSQFKILGLFQQQGTEEKEVMVQCPPGKVPVIENGETRCLVKERVEIPFESVVAMPDVNYGISLRDAYKSIAGLRACSPKTQRKGLLSYSGWFHSQTQTQVVVIGESWNQSDRRSDLTVPVVTFAHIKTQTQVVVIGESWNQSDRRSDLTVPVVTFAHIKVVSNSGFLLSVPKKRFSRHCRKQYPLQDWKM